MDCGLGGRVHADLMQGILLSEKLRRRTDPSRIFGGLKGATTRLTAPAYWKFESIFLQRGVHCEPDFLSPTHLPRYIRRR